MRLMMILGGLIGFLIGIGSSVAQNSSGPTMLWRASVAALLAGLLLRWWGGVWLKCLAQAQQQSGNDKDVDINTGTVPVKV